VNHTDRLRSAARLLPDAWAIVLALLMLGPALGRGYVLSYDMVWVPDLAMRSDFLGLSPSLPRAVPSDAVIAILDEVVPGMLLQKVVLGGALVLAGLGAQRLVGTSIAARLVATSVYVWNPFVAERLWIGHWPLLLAYAVLPWLAIFGARARTGAGLAPALYFLLPLGSLSANAGMTSALMLLASGLRWHGGRLDLPHNLRLLAVALGANAPWLVAGLLHGSAATTRSGSFFAVAGEGRLPPFLSAVGLGGIWNSEVVPSSREGLLPLLWLTVLVVVLIAGWRPWWERFRGSVGPALVICWTVGLGLAMVGVVTPVFVDWLAATVPGGGLLRDGGRFLALCAPLLASASGTAASVLVARLGRAARVGLTTACMLFPVMVMPDAVWGLGGALSPAEYPPSYAAARHALADAYERDHGFLLVLPFTSYRAPAWNDHHKVLDPLGRYLTPDFVVSDDLSISGVLVGGEDPRGPRVRAALSRGTPTARARGLAQLGIQYVATETDAGGQAPPLAATGVYSRPELVVARLDVGAEPRSEPSGWRFALGAAWLAFAMVPVVGVATIVRRRLAVVRRDRAGRC